MQVMLFLYFFRIRLLPVVQAIAYATAFCLIAAMFNFNGGLADFRMDLLQYLLMTNVMVAYLIARALRNIAWWVLLGFFVGILCLGRATSPVYLMPIFAMLACVDLIFDTANWRRIFVRWIVAVVTAVVVSAWYFVGNYDRLHFYYVVWNTDAHAQLPLAASAAHINFVYQHIGVELLTVLTIISSATVAVVWRQQGLGTLRNLNWRALIFSAVPLGYLVLSGSGLNMFVSIVCVGGIVLFLLDPIAGPRTQFRGSMLLLVITALGAACAINAYRGIGNHSRDDVVPAYIPHRDGLAKLITEITETVRQHGASRIYTFSVAYNSSISGSTLVNSLIYDLGFRPNKGDLVQGQVSLRRIEHGLSSATLVEWRNIPGKTDEEKIAAALARMLADVDFVIVAEEGTDLPNHVFVTRFVPTIRGELLRSGRWVQKVGSIQISRTERAMLLLNKRRLGYP